MQTTPHPERTSTPTHFSATLENQASGTIYNTKYMFAIRKKNQCAERQLMEYSHKVMIGGPLNADNSTFSENISANAVFCYI